MNYSAQCATQTGVAISRNALFKKCVNAFYKEITLFIAAYFKLVFVEDAFGISMRFFHTHD